MQLEGFFVGVRDVAHAVGEIPAFDQTVEVASIDAMAGSVTLFGRADGHEPRLYRCLPRFLLTVEMDGATNAHDAEQGHDSHAADKQIRCFYLFHCSLYLYQSLFTKVLFLLFIPSL